MAKKRSDDDDLAIGWIMLAGGVGLGLIFLFGPRKDKPGVTVTKAVPRLEPPSQLPDLGAVSARFDEVRELYTMGYVTPAEARSQALALAETVSRLVEARRGDPGPAQELAQRIGRFLDQVRAFEAEMAAVGA